MLIVRRAMLSVMGIQGERSMRTEPMGGPKNSVAQRAAWA